jgi:hypothetical protein
MTERILARMLGALVAAAAFAQPAQAEGGLPGSPAAVRPGPAAAPTAAPAPPESLGGAIFNPFAAPASVTARRLTSVERDSGSRRPDYALRAGATAPTTTNSPGTR